jgi:hypothetical protein
VLCWITDEGMALLAALDEPVERVDGECVAALSSGQLQLLVESLDRVRA